MEDDIPLAFQDYPVDVNPTQKIKIHFIDSMLDFARTDVWHGYLAGLNDPRFADSVEPPLPFNTHINKYYWPVNVVIRMIHSISLDPSKGITHVGFIQGDNNCTWWMLESLRQFGIKTFIIATEDPHKADQGHILYQAVDHYFTVEKAVAETEVAKKKSPRKSAPKRKKVAKKKETRKIRSFVLDNLSKRKLGKREIMQICLQYIKSQEKLGLAVKSANRNVVVKRGKNAIPIAVNVVGRLLKFDNRDQFRQKGLKVAKGRYLANTGDIIHALTFLGLTLQNVNKEAKAAVSAKRAKARGSKNRIGYQARRGLARILKILKGRRARVPRRHPHICATRFSPRG